MHSVIQGKNMKQIPLWKSRSEHSSVHSVLYSRSSFHFMSVNQWAQFNTLSWQGNFFFFCHFSAVIAVLFVCCDLHKNLIILAPTFCIPVHRCLWNRQGCCWNTLVPVYHVAWNGFTVCQTGYVHSFKGTFLGTEMPDAVACRWSHNCMTASFPRCNFTASGSGRVGQFAQPSKCSFLWIFSCDCNVAAFARQSPFGPGTLFWKAELSDLSGCTCQGSRVIRHFRVCMAVHEICVTMCSYIGKWHVRCLFPWREVLIIYSRSARFRE